MKEHTRVERDLKRDIHFKNILRKELVSHIDLLHQWQDVLITTKNVRREKKMRETVTRYRGFISELKDLLGPMLDELENRINNEMKFSEKEIIQFKEETETEKAAVIDARQAFENAQKNLDEAETDQKISGENLKEIRGKFSKAYKALRLENHKLEEAKEELVSEYRDKEIFARELKRIYLEKHFVSGQ